MGFDIKAFEKWVSCGFIGGAGDGQTTVCVEQAVALCSGVGLTDSPECINPLVANTGRNLNDQRWSSEKARAAGLRRFAYAQLGTSNDGSGPLPWFNSDQWRRAFGAAALVAIQEKLKCLGLPPLEAMQSYEQAKAQYGGSANDWRMALWAVSMCTVVCKPEDRDHFLAMVADIAADKLREQGAGMDPPPQVETK